MLAPMLLSAGCCGAAPPCSEEAALAASFLVRLRARVRVRLGWIGLG
jgi:hypothetical protein